MFKHRIISAAVAAILALTTAACDPEEILSAIPAAEVSQEQSDHLATVAYVNNLPYQHGDPAPALEAFQIVAADRGWAPADIQAWLPFADAVMARESGYCPNPRRGAIFTGVGCELKRQGRASDSGFAQAIGMWYRGPGTFLCDHEGLCSSEAITSSAWSSAVSFIAILERPNGSSNWCYTDKLRRGYVCRLRP